MVKHNKSKRLSIRHLSMQELESRLPLATTAFLGVVPAGTSNPADIKILAIGENDSDTFTFQTLDAASGFSGHVLAEISGVNVPGGRIFGAYDVAQLQANAASNGGNFKGIDAYGLAGDDLVDASQLKNLERTSLNGDGRSVLGFPVDVEISDKDVLIGGEQSRDQFNGGSDAETKDGKNNDIVRNADDLDTLPVVSPPNPVGFDPSILGGTGDNTLEFNPNSPGVSFDPVDFKNIIATNNGDDIDASGTPFGVNIQGLGGDDILRGTDSDDAISGGEGKDTIFGQGGKDNLNGGGGDDTIEGGGGEDTIEGNDGNDTLRGGDANDTIRGGNGNDFLDGNVGNDSLFGDDGDDVLRGSEGDDKLNGGNGSDTADYSTSPAGVDIELNKNKTNNDGFGNKDDLTDIENLNGSDFEDLLIGDDGDNRINANDGADTIKSLNGNDEVNGGGGDDRVNSGEGNDIVNGDGGNDLILGRAGDDRLNGGSGADTIFGELGMDMITGGTGPDRVNGGLGLDYLEGGPNEVGGESGESATDSMETNYDLLGAAIEDLAVVGGPAFTDNFFVETLVFDTEKKGDFDPFQKPGPAMNQNQRIDSQFELDARLQPANIIGARNIIFSDFDGGDGATGDTLFFDA